VDPSAEVAPGEATEVTLQYRRGLDWVLIRQMPTGRVTLSARTDDPEADDPEALLQQLADPALIRHQLAEYRAAGFDTDLRPQTEASKTGALLRRHTPDVVVFNEAWATELRRFTYRDQMSIDYAAWRLGMTIRRWPGRVRDNPYFLFHD
jgi:hypothetical protein